MAARVKLALTVLQVATYISLSSAVIFPQWCVLPSTVHVRQNETCTSLASVADTKVIWHAMRGEQESKQVVLDLHQWPSEYNLTATFFLKVSELKIAGMMSQRAPLPAVEWYQVGYVDCKHTTRYPDSGGGWRPDPLLSPLENSVILLESGVSQPIWLNILIPASAPSGQYSGNITLVVSSPQAGVLQQTVEVELTVWDILLPTLQQAKFPAIFSFNPGNLDVVYGTPTESLKNQFYSLFAGQRLAGDNLYTTVPTNVSLAAYLADMGVQWLSLYDVYGAAGIQAGKVKGACVNFTDDLVQKVLDILTPVITEYETEGILKHMFVYGFDEAPSYCEESIRKIFGAIKAKWSDLRTVAVLNWLPPLDLPLDVWVLQYQEYNKTEADPWIAAGKQQWWYHCIEPSGSQYLNTFIERPLIMARLLYWLASSQQVGGWLYYSDVMWKRHPSSSAAMQRLNKTARTDFDPANYIWLPRTDIFANGDGNFVYPGKNGPIPTVRSHNLRDGFEDAELFRMLPLEKVGPIVEPLVRSPTDYTLDPLLLEKQRILAAAAVVSRN